MPNSSSNGASAVPSNGTGSNGSNVSRHASIVEMLSSPPQLLSQQQGQIPPYHQTLEQQPQQQQQQQQQQHHHHHQYEPQQHQPVGQQQQYHQRLRRLSNAQPANPQTELRGGVTNTNSMSPASLSVNPNLGLLHPQTGSASSSSLNSLSSASRDNDSELVKMTPTTTQCLQHLHSQKWQHTPLSQLVEQNKLIFVSGSASVEEAFNLLMKHHLTSLPVEAYEGDMNCLTFDYNDLNSYLLLALNKIQVQNKEIQQDCQNGKPVPVGEMVKLTPKNPFYKLPETDSLSHVMGILGSGVHRVAITNPEMTKIKGILSQRRLIRHLWENARSFSNLEHLFNSSLQKLGIGILNSHTKPTSRQSRVISIQGDEPLIMALYKMHMERISSIAVVDQQDNLIGNISVTDVKHVTRTSQYPLLHKSCRHFISVILNVRGLEMGKDSFPIFHVYPTSSLARTLAKLVATQSHRLWIVQPPDLPLDATGHHEDHHTSVPAHMHSPIMSAIEDPPSPTLPTTNLFEKEYRTGKLIGVVSLTDILSLLARSQTEHKQVDPQSARRQRGSLYV
ncbi:protein sds23 [Zygosaccharomyces mellis]|uniref:Protein sds23 n=1 Tax=Zygosaccharomyces mellis TaxID=42258 RepID=A0A4C2E9B5_9SACH|nr:protein sds23 [Zygosaccharomyces mellis]